MPTADQRPQEGEAHRRRLDLDRAAQPSSEAKANSAEGSGKWRSAATSNDRYIRREESAV